MLDASIHQLASLSRPKLCEHATVRSVHSHCTAERFPPSLLHNKEGMSFYSPQLTKESFAQNLQPKRRKKGKRTAREKTKDFFSACLARPWLGSFNCHCKFSSLSSFSLYFIFTLSFLLKAVQWPFQTWALIIPNQICSQTLTFPLATALLKARAS